MHSPTKKEIILISTLLVIALFLFISGCKQVTCPKNQILIDDACCYDMNFNFECDYDEGLTVCGDKQCDSDENCSTCKTDCGLCKVFHYIYYPTNFSLKNITTHLDGIYENRDIKFRKDIEVDDEVFDYYYYNENQAKYIADLLGSKYHPQKSVKFLVISKTDLDHWYLNRTDALTDWANHSRYYMINEQLIKERKHFTDRIAENRAKMDYPVPPTGHERQTRYEDWVAGNYTISENIIADNITKLDRDIIWSVYASISGYEIRYAYTTYEDWIDKETGEKLILHDYKNITEVKMDYVNTLTVKCARNIAVTLFDYEYDFQHYKIGEDRLKIEIDDGKDRLLKKAKIIRSMCNKKYSAGVFMP